MVATRTQPARTLRVLGNPIPGLVRAVLAVRGAVGVYTFARTGADTVRVATDDGREYETDTWANTCSCQAGRFNKPCKHLASVRKLEALGHL